MQALSNPLHHQQDVPPLAQFPATASVEQALIAVTGHVKWFHDYSFTDRPENFNEVLTPLVVTLVLVGAIAVISLVFIDRFLAMSTTYGKISEWFEERRIHGPLAMRVGAGMTLLLSWQADALLVPDLPVEHAWIGWLQFAIAITLIFPRLMAVAGAGILFLWILGVGQYGLFHMLDYLLFVGVAVYFIASVNRRVLIIGLGVPALYFSLGFSLIWVALEKLVYPQWGLAILADNQHLTLGLDDDLFLAIIAVSELTLGFLLIIGLLGRPLVVVITLVLFTTALTFGKVEVVGHTIIHASLIVLLLEGEGRIYPAPISIHRQISLRVAFAGVNYLLVFAFLFSIYIMIAHYLFEQTTA